MLKVGYKVGIVLEQSQNMMVCSPSSTLSTALFFVIGLALVVRNQEEIGNYFGSVLSDAVLNDLVQKCSLISKQSLLLRT